MEFNAAERFYDFFTNFKDYEDYLDSKITPTDLFYLKVSNPGSEYEIKTHIHAICSCAVLSISFLRLRFTGTFF